MPTQHETDFERLSQILLPQARFLANKESILFEPEDLVQETITRILPLLETIEEIEAYARKTLRSLAIELSRQESRWRSFVRLNPSYSRLMFKTEVEASEHLNRLEVIVALEGFATTLPDSDRQILRCLCGEIDNTELANLLCTNVNCARVRKCKLLKQICRKFSHYHESKIEPHPSENPERGATL